MTCHATPTWGSPSHIAHELVVRGLHQWCASWHDASRGSTSCGRYSEISSSDIVPKAVVKVDESVSERRGVEVRRVGDVALTGDVALDPGVFGGLVLGFAAPVRISRGEFLGRESETRAECCRSGAVRLSPPCPSSHRARRST